MRFVGFSSAEAGAVVIINSSDRQTSNRFIVISKAVSVLTGYFCILLCRSLGEQAITYALHNKPDEWTLVSIPLLIIEKRLPH